MQIGKEEFHEYWYKCLRMLRSVETNEEREKFDLNLYADHGDIGESDSELKCICKWAGIAQSV
jgi:hypothetical protein